MTGISVLTAYVPQIDSIVGYVHFPKHVHEVKCLVHVNLHLSMSVWATKVVHFALTGVGPVDVFIL